MFNPFGPNVVDGPFSWLDTRPVYLGRPPWVHKSRILVRTSPPNLGVDVGLVPDRPTLLRLNIAIQNRSETVELLTCDCLGAGDGNRTRVISMEGWGSTIELRPQDMVGTTGFEPATSCSQSRSATKLRHVPKVLSS